MKSARESQDGKVEPSNRGLEAPKPIAVQVGYAYSPARIETRLFSKNLQIPTMIDKLIEEEEREAAHASAENKKGKRKMQ